jgi:hypothetical protein
MTGFSFWQSFPPGEFPFWAFAAMAKMAARATVDLIFAR